MHSMSYSGNATRVVQAQLILHWVVNTHMKYTELTIQCLCRWVGLHEEALKEGRAAGPQEDALPCIRLLPDEHTMKRLAKVSHVFVQGMD